MAAITGGLGAVRPEEIVAAAERVKLIQETQAEIQGLEEDAAVARLGGTQRLMEQINLEERRRVAEFEKLMRDPNGPLLTEGEFQRARLALATDAEAQRIEVMQKAAEEQRRQIESTAREWESMYDRIVGGAKSASDVLKNIWRELGNAWKRQVFEMLAASAQGLPASGGATSGRAGAGTGILGSILTGGFGFPGGGFGGPGGVAGTPPFIPPQASQFANSAFTSSTVPGTQPTAAASLGLPATTPIGDILARIAPHGIGPVSGPGVALGGLTLAGMTIGNRNRAVSALGGLAGGALTGFSVGGPIGAVIGAAVGGIAGLLTGGGGKEKERDAAIANAGFTQLRELLEDYYRFRRDFDSTFGGMQTVWQQMTQQFVRPQSASSQRPYFDQIVDAMRRVEDERNRRRQLLAMMVPPEFEHGGFVSPQGTQRGIMATLHPGEYVMQQSAVERLGVNLLESLNAGRSAPAAGGGIEVAVGRATAKAIADILKKDPGALDEPLMLLVTGNMGRFSKVVR